MGSELPLSISVPKDRYMKITLAICTNRGVRPKTAQCLLELVNYSKEIDFQVLVAERGYTVAENRNYCVEQAKRNGSEYLLFIDDDMTFPPNTLESLLSHKKEVVGVRSYSRCFPLSQTVGVQDKNGDYMHPNKHMPHQLELPPELTEVYFVGMGIGLIDLKVFEKIKSPYFMFTYDKNGQVKNGEDGTFCAKVKKEGMKVWCDPTIPVGHLGEHEFKRQIDNEII